MQHFQENETLIVGRCVILATFVFLLLDAPVSLLYAQMKRERERESLKQLEQKKIKFHNDNDLHREHLQFISCSSGLKR